MKRYIKKILITLLLIALLYFAYTITPLKVDRNTLQSDLYSIEIDRGSITYIPKINTTYGFVLYPGAKVKPESYSFIAEELAKKGILTKIVKMPLNFAILGIDKGLSIPPEFSQISNWYIGGHSLGGASAALSLAKKINGFKGLILLASYSSKDLSKSGLEVLSLSASQDGLATPTKVSKYKVNLPSNTNFVTIEGGNHTQFGYYGNNKLQKGDKEATIDKEEQQRIIVEEISSFILK